jgi:hypothetical protein
MKSLEYEKESSFFLIANYKMLSETEDTLPSAPLRGAEWGPLLWKLFHTLAEWSDRRDIVYRWKHVMDLTAVTIPCEICRRHMQDYLRSHSIFVRAPEPVLRKMARRVKRPIGWIPEKGMDVKVAIRKGIWKFHNHVNSSTGATEMTEEEAIKLYEGSDRSTACKMIRELLIQIDSLWKPHARISYKEWISEVVALIALIESGSY